MVYAGWKNQSRHLTLNGYQLKHQMICPGEYVRYSGFGEWDTSRWSRKQGQYTIGYSGVYGLTA